MEFVLRKMTAFREEDRIRVDNQEIFKLKEYQKLMKGNIDLTSSTLYNDLN